MCWNTFFFDSLVIFRHNFTGNGKVSCILATITSDWFPTKRFKNKSCVMVFFSYRTNTETKHESPVLNFWSHWRPVSRNFEPWPVWSRFNSRARRHMWVEFIVGSCPCSKGFSPTSPVFLPPQKSTLLNSYLIWKQWMKSHFVEMPLQIPIYFYFILFMYMICG